MHFADRGANLDFALVAGGGRILDFGPGDGWPSLIIAQFCEAVVGVDASARRVAVCQENAHRLGINNAHFVHAPSSEPLPFADGEFDGAVAASSIEQTPSPYASLSEIHRVLKPGGKLRMKYEALEQYSGGREREAWISGVEHYPAFLVIYDRNISGETVVQYRLSFDMSSEELRNVFSRHGMSTDYSGLSREVLGALLPLVTSTACCATQHPSGSTFVSILAEVGFTDVYPTHSGGAFARQLFDLMPSAHRPSSLEGVDCLLRPITELVVALPAPIENDPRIAALK
jgi:SAM-dependent methyltransferase